MLALRQALLSPIRVFGSHDALDRANAIVEPAGSIVELVQQPFVAVRQRLRLLPLGDVVKDQPRKPDEEDRNDR